MTNEDAIKEVRFNMSTIGLKEEAAKRGEEAFFTMENIENIAKNLKGA